MDEARHFITVEWCGDGKRGIFCSAGGNPFSKADEAHTRDEMWEVLGPFAMILGPQSLTFTEAELEEYSYFRPLSEYHGGYGIALREDK